MRIACGGAKDPLCPMTTREMKTNEYFKALYPDELVARYRAGERDFEGINLLREELESLLGPTVVPFDSWYSPISEDREEQQSRKLFCPLWADRSDVEPRFGWDQSGRFCSAELDDGPQTKTLTGLDLRGIKLTSAYLYPIDLSGADLRGAILKRAVMIDGRLSGVNFSRADLRDARLDTADLTGTNFYMARLDRCDLGRAILKQATLDRAKLRKTILSYADLTGSSIRHARFDEAFLFGTCLSDVDLDGCDLSTCCVGELRISRSQQEQLLQALGISWQ